MLDSRHHDIQSERYLLGCAFWSLRPGEATRDIVEGVDKKWFYDRDHQTIFQVIVDLHNEGHQVTTKAMVTELRKRDLLEKVGGEQYLNGIDEDIYGLSNIPLHIERIAELYKVRQLHMNCLAASQELLEDPLKLPVHAETLEKTLAIETKPVSHAPVTVGALTVNFLTKVETVNEEGDKEVIPSGFPLVDELIEIVPTEMTCIAGRPSMGKSAFALQVAFNAARAGKRTFFVSLEMRLDDIMRRLFSWLADIPARRIKKGDLDTAEWQRMYAAQAQLLELPLHFIHAGTYSVKELRKAVRYLKLQYGELAMVVVDYMQLMEGETKSENRVQEVSGIARGLKRLAVDEEIAVIPLSQLSREVEKRQDKRPMMSDLRESGAIEQDCAGVMFVYRHEYYFPDDAESRRNAEIIVAKNRHGDSGTAKLGWRPEYTEFTNLHRASSVVQAI